MKQKRGACFFGRAGTCQRGGALIDVLGATAILAAMIYLIAATRDDGLSDAIAEQMGWHHRQVALAAVSHVMGNAKTIASTLNDGDVVAVQEADYLARIPIALRTVDGNSTSVGAFETRYCVLVRQLFSQNTSGVKTATGQLEVLVLGFGGQALPLVARRRAMVAGGALAGVVDESGIATGYRDTWTLDTRPMYLADVQRNCGPVQPTSTLASYVVVDSLGADMTKVEFNEYLSRTPNVVSDTGTMRAPLWLGARDDGNLANVDNLGALSFAAADSTCSSAIVGTFARTPASTATTTSGSGQLLRCEYMNATNDYRYKKVSGIIATPALSADSILVASSQKENAACYEYPTGTLARTDIGVPLVCDGKEGVLNDKHWLRIGVPWSWVSTNTAFISNDLLCNGTRDYTVDMSSVPIGSKLVQFFGVATMQSAGLGSIGLVMVKNSTEYIVPMVTNSATAAASLGNTFILGRTGVSSFKFRMSAVGGCMYVNLNLIGYSY